MTGRPLAIDLYCGLGGWAEGFLAEGYDVLGFDIERHDYGTGGYPGQLVLQDALTIDGARFKDAAVIVASPPCQKYSYMAMPWSKAKELIRHYEASAERREELNALFNACFRIQREASDAAGHHIPLIVENVRGAQRWVGRAKWRFGSYFLWGDLPALMPINSSRKTLTGSWDQTRKNYNPDHSWKNGELGGGSWFGISKTNTVLGMNPDGRKIAHAVKHAEHDRGVKSFTPNGEPLGKNTLGRKHGSKSPQRKAASAQIAKIPFPLAQHIAKSFRPAAQ